MPRIGIYIYIVERTLYICFFFFKRNYTVRACGSVNAESDARNRELLSVMGEF